MSDVLKQTYTFDTAGRTTSKSLSNGSTIQYTDAMLYDFRDRMTQQSRTQSSGGNLWSKFSYNTLDLVTTAEQGTGSVTSNPELVQTTTRDLAGRPTSISYQSGTNSLATYSMAYVSASNRLASLTTPQGTTNYNYSANGQLIQAGSTGYTYDANGNPTNRAGKTTQIGTWNRLLDDGDFTYQYDAEGRTTVRTSKTTGQTESYVWNRRGQLTQIDVHSNASLTSLTGQVNYSYDPTGRRTSVRNQTGIGSGSYAQSVDYLMSDGDQVGQILGATGQTTRRFRYGIGVDSVLSEQRFSGGTAGTPEYQLTDHLGTVRGVAQRTTGVNAVVVNTLQYDSFGKLISQSNALKQPYHGFAGRDIEPVGGLTYNRNRYYSTQSGRFISQDPIGFAAGDENLYRYVGNKPTMATDPSGLYEEPPLISAVPDSNGKTHRYQITPQGDRKMDNKMLDELAGKKSKGFSRGSHVWHHESFDRKTGTFTMTLVNAADHNMHHKLYKNGAWSQWTDWATEIISKGQSSSLTPAQFDALKNGFAYAEGTKDIMGKLAKTGHSFRLAAGNVLEILQNGQLVESIASQVKAGTLIRYTKRFAPKIPGAIGTIFIIGAGGSAFANGKSGGEVFEAMGREAVGADLIESGFRMVIVDAGTPVYNYVVDPGGVISRRSGPLTDRERAELIRSTNEWMNSRQSIFGVMDEQPPLEDAFSRFWDWCMGR
ncbi:RHS repeat-associated core domain-containing protein [Pirellulaceae bacterium SH449]